LVGAGVGLQIKIEKVKRVENQKKKRKKNILWTRVALCFRTQRRRLTFTSAHYTITDKKVARDGIQQARERLQTAVTIANVPTSEGVSRTRIGTTLLTFNIINLRK